MDYSFGRFTDAFKANESVKYWNDAVDFFDKKNYFASFRSFISYLRNEDNSNLNVTDSDGQILFNLKQGTKIINVQISERHVTAFTAIVAFEKPAVSFMRRLLEMNFGLFYSRFAINDNKVIIKFDSSIIDCSPNKLYFALKEVALKADRLDELLPQEFPSLKPISDDIKESFPDSVKLSMLKYFRKWLKESVDYIAPLNQTSFEGGISYMLLSVIYKIDFFLKPQGKILSDLEKLSSQYFSKDNRPYTEKNDSMISGFKKLLELSDEDILSSFYECTYTFSILNPTEHSTVVNIIKDNINNIKWYVDNNHLPIANSIYEYIIGYCYYNYGMVRSVRNLFSMGYFVLNSDFINEINPISMIYSPEAAVFDSEKIIANIKNSIAADSGEYINLNFDTSKLNFTAVYPFLNSFYNEISNLNYNQA